MTRFLMLVVLVGGIVGGGVYYRQYVLTHPNRQEYRTEKATKGDLHITVGATGTIEPEEVVDVGAQVTGRIDKLGPDPRGVTNAEIPTAPAIADTQNGKGLVAAAPDAAFAGKPVDYGSPVKKDGLLAQIDKSVYEAQYDQANAALAQAQAHVLQSQAMVKQANAEWERAQKLRDLKIPSRSPTGDASLGGGLTIVGISDSDFVLAEANAESTKADLAAAQATVLQQRANLKLADTNLKYTTINSPIDGTIIDRRVNIGQTVVSNLSASSLFLIARDLSKMQVWASVNEADIARLNPGTKVHFRVDAFPQDTFRGIVFQKRLNALMTQNVVTYTVVISVNNADLKLLPYLTADVKFEVDERKDVLLVPNAALRFKPNGDQILDDSDDDDAPTPKADDTSKTADDAKTSDAPKGGDAPKSRGSHGGHHNKSADTRGTLWQVDAETGKLRGINVQIGLSDGAFTEITAGDIKEGDDFVVSEQQAAAASGGDVTNPFAPPRFGKGGGRR